MKFSGLLKRMIFVKIPEGYEEEFQKETDGIMFVRYRAAAYALILLSILMSVIVTVSKGKVLGSTLLVCYIGMYVLMIVVMVGYLVVYSMMAKGRFQSPMARNVIITTIPSFVLGWSLSVAVLDQIVYNQILLYIITVLAVAEFTYIKPIKMLGIYGVCHFMFALVLPRYHIPQGIVFVNLVNSGVFVAMSWVISRMLYKRRIEEFINSKAIEEKNNRLSHVNQQLQQANLELEKLSVTDSLSELYNRRKFNELVDTEWHRAYRYREHLSLVFIDIDFFKEYNDKYGHQAGDECIRSIAKVLRESVRRSIDIIARYGGEEFIVILPNTDNDQAYEVAETIRKNVEALNIIHEASSISPYVTISAGVNSIIPDERSTVEEFLGGADKALYMAKEMNRNRTIVYRA